MNYEIIVTHRSDGSATVHLHYNGYPCRQQRDCADDAATTACVAEYEHLWKGADVTHVREDGQAWTFGQEAPVFSVGMRVVTVRDIRLSTGVIIPMGEYGNIVDIDPLVDGTQELIIHFDCGELSVVHPNGVAPLPQPGDGLPAQTLREGGAVLADDEDMTYAHDDMPTVWRRDYETLRSAALDVLTGMTARTVDRLWQLVTEE